MHQIRIHSVVPESAHRERPAVRWQAGFSCQASSEKFNLKQDTEEQPLIRGGLARTLAVVSLMDGEGSRRAPYLRTWIFIKQLDKWGV